MTDQYTITIAKNGYSIYCYVCGYNVFTNLEDLFQHIIEEEKERE